MARNNLDVLQLGADPTGAASSVRAFAAAIAWANAHAAGLRGGCEIAVPAGRYRVDAALPPVTAGGVVFRGSQAAALSVSAAGPVFTWSGGASGGGIDGLTVEYPARPAADAAVITVAGASDLLFRNLRVSNINTLAVLGTDARRIASAVTFDQVSGKVFNSGRPSFDLRWGSALFLNGVGLYVAGVPVPAPDRASVMTTVPGTDFIRCAHGGWDTLVLSGGTNCNRYDHGVQVDAPGAVIQNLWLDNSIFDYCASDAIRLHAPSHASGGVFLVSCRGAYIVSWSGSGIRVSGDNPNELHDFSGAAIYVAGRHGVHLSGPGTRNIKLHRMRISNPNRLQGAYAGVRVDPIGGDWEVIGGTVLADPSGGFGWRASYGIDIAAPNDRYTVQGANFVGALANYRVEADGSASANRLITGNLNADYAAASVWVEAPAGRPWVNTTPWNVTVAGPGGRMLPPGHRLEPAASPRRLQIIVHP